MANLPPLRRLQVEEFPKEKGWIQPLFLVINNFMEAVVGALNKGLTLTDNTTADLKTLTLSAPPTTTSPVSVAWSKAFQPDAVLVGDVELSTGAAFTLSSAVQVQWQMSSDGKSLQVTNVVGITPSSTTQYFLTLVCFAR